MRLGLADEVGELPVAAGTRLAGGERLGRQAGAAEPEIGAEGDGGHQHDDQRRGGPAQARPGAGGLRRAVPRPPP